MSVLQRHDGMIFASSGRVEIDFSSGGEAREKLALLCGVFGGTLVDTLSSKTDILIVGKSGGTKTAERLNAKGAHIECIDEALLGTPFTLTPAEMLELIHAGEPGLSALLTLTKLLRHCWQIPSIAGADLRGADLCGLTLRSLAGADLRNANLTDVSLAGSYESGRSDCRKVRFEGANLRDAYIGNVDLRGVDLSGNDLREVHFSSPLLAGANLRGAQLQGAKFYELSLATVDLTGAQLAGAEFGEDVVLAGAILRDVDLSEVKLAVNLDGADLRGSVLKLTESVNMRGADLRDADLRGANLAAADLRGANIEGADFTGANVVCMRFHDATGIGQLGEACQRLREMIGGKSVSVTVPIELPSEARVEVTLGSRRYQDRLFCSWALTGPNVSAAGSTDDIDDIQDVGRWLGGEQGTVRLDRVSLYKRPSVKLGHRTADVEQRARDAFAELLAVPQLDAKTVEATEKKTASRFARKRDALASEGEEVILAKLDQAPGDEQQWLVYADWLQEQGDPRGELIAREYEVRDDKDKREQIVAHFVTTHSEAILGDLGDLGGWHGSYRWGFLRSLTLCAGRNSKKVCRRLTTHPATRFLHSLSTNTAAATVLPALFELAETRPIEYFSLASSVFRDMERLAPLTKLKHLWLGATQIVDVNVLSTFTDLETLTFYSTDVSDIGPLAGMLKLEWLDLGRTNVTTIAPLAGLTKMRRLDIAHQRIDDLEVLTKLNNLQWLRVHRGQLDDSLAATLKEANPTLELDEVRFDRGR